MLPSAEKNNDSVRTFALLGPASSAKPFAKDIKAMLKILGSRGSSLRIRIRGEHELTGFGKVYESKFALQGQEFNRL